ncbi:cell migration-inducing protein, hyaluronan-binding, partial [Elysia marginata]
KSDSPGNVAVPGFGRKFIGAASGSRLELHGKQKKSWTKLVATVSPGCQPLYDSKKQAKRGRTGIWLNVWSANGTSLGLFTYRLEGHKRRNILTNLANKIKHIPDGRIVSVAVFKSLGKPTRAFDNVYRAIEALGGTRIRQVGQNEPYVLIAETGRPDCAIERHTSRHQTSHDSLEASATFPHGDVVFRARRLVQFNLRYSQFW